MPSALPLANVFTLGVRDFGAERGFYRRLGWPLVLDRDDFVVFELRGALLALFPEDRGNGGIRCSIIISKEPTDAEFFDGRDAYFRDPEGNFWEIAWASPDNPVVVAARRVAGLV